MSSALRLFTVSSFLKARFQPFEEKLRSAMADARRWLADGLIQQATPQAEMERRRIAADINELYLLGTSLRFDTSPHRPDIGIIRAFDRKIVALLPLVSAIEDRLTLLRRLGPLDPKLSQVVGRRSRLAGVEGARATDIALPSSRKPVSPRRPPSVRNQAGPIS